MPDVCRTVNALRLDLVPDGSFCLIVWPETPPPIARPVDRRQHWLDLRRGDQIYVAGKRHTLAAVRNYRSTPVMAEGTEILSGRDWETIGDRAGPRPADHSLNLKGTD